MMFKQLQIHISGTGSLILHNKQLANPNNEFAKGMKEITSKRSKTDEDYAILSRLEWMGSLYLGSDGQPIIPGEMIEGMYAAAASKKRKKATARAGLWCEDGSEGWGIQYDGPQDAKALWNAGIFTHTAIVSPQGKNSKIVRTLPKFKPWSLVYVVTFDATIINQSDVEEWTKIGGQYCGLGDFRPRNGRFEVQSIKPVVEKTKKAG